jgi:DNA helicase-2/ATP-dependent DNA helicase PcrA
MVSFPTTPKEVGLIHGLAENTRELTQAAQEMLKRVGLLIGTQSDRVCGGTFHSVANLLLRRFGRPIGLDPGFTIIDRGDAEDLLGLLRAQQGLHDKDKRFPR